VLRGKDVRDEVKKLRKDYTDMRYCFSDEQVNKALDALLTTEGL
jgi:hypothetical protein